MSPGLPTSGPTEPSQYLRAVSTTAARQPIFHFTRYSSLGSNFFPWQQPTNRSKTRDSYSLQSEPQVFPGWLCQLFSSNCFWGRGNPHINGIPKKNVMVTKQGESSDNRRKCWKIPFHLATAVWRLDMSTPGNKIWGQRFPLYSPAPLQGGAHILWVQSYSSFRFLKIFF